MQVQEPLTITLEPNSLHCWAEESTASALRTLAVRLHCAGLSLCETAAALETFGVNRSHQAVFQRVHRVAEEASDPPTAKLSRVAIDETAVKINGDWTWVYTAIDLDSRLILDVTVFGRRGTDPAAAFLQRLTEKHDLSETVFLVDNSGYLTALSRLELSEYISESDFIPSKFRLTASTTRGSAIDRSSEVVLSNSCITITQIDRASHSTDKRQRRCFNS